MGCKILSMSSSFLLDFFREGQNLHYEVDKNGLPPDAKIIGCQFDISCGNLLVLVESSEWPEVREGNHYQQFSPTMRTFYDKLFLDKIRDTSPN